MQHVEFIDTEHFANRYHRRQATGRLQLFIDFFWETDFDRLWQQYPSGFSDILFPNTGYTYLLNLGTPFTMQLGEKKFPMRTDGFLPRNRALECFHHKDNRLFGIKFKTSPIIFEKKVNFSEYRDAIYPLSYLVDPVVVREAKAAASFQERIELLSVYFSRLIRQYDGSLLPVEVVTDVFSSTNGEGYFHRPVTELANEYGISSRTLQRYFETHTGIGTKKALQILRIRKAVEQLVTDPGGFDCAAYGYYDHSHFYKHLKQFLDKKNMELFSPHILLLEKLHGRKK
ncbi:helix-turn-helix domain-containing protein [Sediminibacterium soli]|uniref:helix-turn-helix domain-containing protein n=1 Tax=Sediminibacterium soli TaxID=2698829 RepID=UPI00137ACFBC|nr:helix-turn-helix domain-containing protein [Sediminibacterium soli]NCI47826.1 AraC family transcriptional regulator [Sediminibacterium soli]